MKKSIVLVALGLFSMSIFAQTPKEELQFTTVKEIPVTSVKNQNRSSTCWSYSGLGFLEAELIRLGKGKHDLSEMFIVHKTMQDRAVNYVRYHGDSSFSPGGSFYDIIYCLKYYGLVPQDVMPGIMYGEKLPVHTELDAVAEGYVKGLLAAKLKKLNPIWKKGLAAIYDTYLGVCPEKFTYEGKEYTPKSFAQSLGLNADDYISLTSYTHHPFYSQFAIEIQDNWRNALSYNLPINEFMEVMENAVDKGYTFAWGSDVSEAGFTRNGVALMTEKQKTDLTGSDMARWTGTTFEEKKED
ncbi:MAG: C1 family peptidase, partial [Bacteroides sp.]|nr:C1 family peptidase [Bacteroides sp.]